MIIPLDADYRKATNAAYIELDKYSGNYPAIDIELILRLDPHIRLCTYSAAAARLKCSYNEFAYQVAPSEYGYSAVDKSSGNSIIFYNNRKGEETTRFTLAHELGHIRLGHTDDTIITNKEANCFARNLLCPVPVVQEGKLETKDDYVATFYVSPIMAEFAISHFTSDLYYIRHDLLERIRDKSYCSITGYSLSELYG